ncbi:PLP-dependent aminotransferase family protein [Polyangium jinanense]|uniref:MocR-like pyridoxine biosynthesis transcription factor PdxR n=1 Tax=Polyangium jinanense TaxID=2829994 RepID=UPI0023419C85|nr:PLP-dependent aminotransferase family protein [Polyangium jinanense]MDC3955529.1 PLP-dependent aminotransferase family protein [Polyangium jinanense]
MHRAAYDALRGAILEGRLRPGARLPSTRDLAEQLGVARGTVVAAFGQLAAEGYIVGRHGSGTFVSSDLPDAWLQVKPPGAKRRARPRAPHLSRWGAGLDASKNPFGRSGTLRPFRAHLPALDVFPHEAWSRMVTRAARRAVGTRLADIDIRGVRVLREAIAEHLRVARGVSCSAEQVIVMPSVQQALDITARLVLDPGDRVWMEDPGYVGVRPLLECLGAEIVPLPIDEDGLDVAAGIERAPDARLAYVTPAHQAPLGVTLSIERRLALLDWAAAHGAWIFEDDYDSEYRYEGRPLAALQGLDDAGVVIHAGSFSKTMSPALRLAYVIVPDALLDRFVTAKSVLDRFTPPLAQTALAEFISEGHFVSHLRRMRELYAERRAALLEAITSELGGAIEVIGSNAGLALCVWLPPGVDDRAAASAIAAHSVVATPLSALAIRPLQRGGLLLGFAAFKPARLRAAVVAMSAALAPLLRDRERA